MRTNYSMKLRCAALEFRTGQVVHVASTSTVHKIDICNCIPLSDQPGCVVPHTYSVLRLLFSFLKFDVFN